MLKSTRCLPPHGSFEQWHVSPGALKSHIHGNPHSVKFLWLWKGCVSPPPRWCHLPSRGEEMRHLVQLQMTCTAQTVSVQRNDRNNLLYRPLDVYFQLWVCKKHITSHVYIIDFYSPISLSGAFIKVGFLWKKEKNNNNSSFNYMTEKLLRLKLPSFK